MARNRPGKRERQAAARNAFQTERARIVAANQREAKPERPVYGAPRGLRDSVLGRDSLKLASHNVGFVGPRGFKSPKDTVQPLRKGEVCYGGLAGPRSQAERERAKALLREANKD